MQNFIDRDLNIASTYQSGSSSVQMRERCLAVRPTQKDEVVVDPWPIRLRIES